MNRKKEVGLIITALSFIIAIVIATYAHQAVAQTNSGRDGTASQSQQTALAITPNVSPVDLAGAMGIPSSSIISASYNGSDPLAIGIGDAPLGTYFPTHSNTFAILSTGHATTAELPNTSGSTSMILNANTLKNSQGQDLTQLALQIDIPSHANCLGFDFAFYSEEFPEWVNSEYNDTFTAEIGGTNLTISGTTVIAPNNFAFDPFNQIISVNTVFGVISPTQSTYDGMTPLLRATAPIEANTVAEVVLSIQDLGDSVFDSAVFIDNFFLSSDACQTGTGFAPSDFLIDPTNGGTIEFTNIDGTSTSFDFPAGAVKENTLLTFTPLFSPTQTFKEDPGFIEEAGGTRVFAGQAFNIDGLSLPESTFMPFISKGGSTAQAHVSQNASAFAFATLNNNAAQPAPFYFNEPVTITLNYSEEDWQEAGITSESSLNLWFYDEQSGTWEPANYTCEGIISPLPQPSLNPTTNKYEVPVCHFTEFGFGGFN